MSDKEFSPREHAVICALGVVVVTILGGIAIVMNHPESKEVIAATSREYLIEDVRKFQPGKTVIYARDVKTGKRSVQKHTDDDCFPNIISLGIGKKVTVPVYLAQNASDEEVLVDFPYACESLFANSANADISIFKEEQKVNMNTL